MKISALILTKNEETILEDCLKRLDFADEIIVLDQQSSDNTKKIAKKYADKILESTSTYFDENRNKLAAEAKGEWLLYVDSDELITEELKKEIKRAITEDKFSAFYLARKNYILDRRIRHGGWWPDYAPRLFKKSTLVEWDGQIHESPIIKGKFGYLKEALEHRTARNLNLMLTKSIKWAKIEAELFYKIHNPKVGRLTILKSGTSEFFNRYILRRGILDGTIGLVEAIYQALHKAMIFTYLWEKQNNSHEKFKKIEKKI